jgi:hypothetical protein
VIAYPIISKFSFGYYNKKIQQRLILSGREGPHLDYRTYDPEMMTVSSDICSCISFSPTFISQPLISLEE